MSPALNYKALLYATPTHLPSICPFTRPHVIISALSMHLPPVLWAWIRAPATHFLGARVLTTLPLSIPPAAFSALPQHLPSPFSVIILSSQYLFQRGPIWMPLKHFFTKSSYFPHIKERYNSATHCNPIVARVDSDVLYRLWLQQGYSHLGYRGVQVMRNKYQAFTTTPSIAILYT